jgi:hypothetical protein
MHVTFVSLLKQNGSFRVFASSDAERDARSLLQMPSTRQLAATAVLAVTTAACLWMLMRKATRSRTSLKMESGMLANRTACASFGSPILVVAQATICEAILNGQVAGQTLRFLLALTLPRRGNASVAPPSTSPTNGLHTRLRSCAQFRSDQSITFSLWLRSSGMRPMFCPSGSSTTCGKASSTFS